MLDHKWCMEIFYLCIWIGERFVPSGCRRLALLPSKSWFCMEKEYSLLAPATKHKSRFSCRGICTLIMSCTLLTSATGRQLDSWMFVEIISANRRPPPSLPLPTLPDLYCVQLLSFVFLLGIYPGQSCKIRLLQWKVRRMLF